MGSQASEGLKNGYAEAREGRTVLACVRTTELLVGVQLNAQNVVPELPKNGRVMHFFAVVAVEARVGISLRAKFFPTGL